MSIHIRRALTIRCSGRLSAVTVIHSGKWLARRSTQYVRRRGLNTTAIKACYLTFVLAIALVAANADAADRDSGPEQWFACEQDADCTTVLRGCWHWLSVNKAYLKDVEAVQQICLRSSSAGLRPESICVKKECANAPFRAKDWPHMDGVQKNVLVGPMVKNCLEAARIKLDFYGPLTIRDGYIEQINELIQKERVAGDESLETVIRSVVQCRGVVSRAQKK